MTRGTYGYYSVRSNAVAPKQGFITEGDIHIDELGLFVQDAWTINNKLTVNLGVRTERERVPTYTDRRRTFRSSASSSASPTSWRRASASPTTSRATASWKAVRFVGRLLRHLQARTAARLVRRRQVARVLLHARHLRTSRRWWTAPTARRPALGHADPATDGGSTSVTRRSATTRSNRT